MDCSCLSLLAGALILVILYLAHKYTYWKRQGIPTPKGFVPLVGHIWPVLSTKSNLGSLFQKWYNEFQDSSMVGYYKATSPALMIRDRSKIGEDGLTDQFFELPRQWDGDFGAGCSYKQESLLH